MAAVAREGSVDGGAEVRRFLLICGFDRRWSMGPFVPSVVLRETLDGMEIIFTVVLPYFSKSQEIFSLKK